MFQVAKLTAFALVASTVSAHFVPRSAPPAGWFIDYLEDYVTYHSRYLALDCRAKHNTDFFEHCCHPLLATERLSTRPAQCNLASTSEDEEEECDDDEEEGDALTSSIAYPAHKAPVAIRASEAKVLASEGLAANLESAPNAASQLSKSSSTRSAAATVYTGGDATYYYQYGVAGACGKVHSDSEMIGAIDGDRYGKTNLVSSQCNKQVKITNLNNAKTVTITIADACPSCKNSNSIDLSEAAFKKIASLDDGRVPISWSYV